MRKEICENPKVIYYWMTKAEQESTKEILAEEFKEWKQKKYRVCVFVSGTKNLTELTGKLLAHHKQVLAEKDSENQTLAQDTCAA